MPLAHRPAFHLLALLAALAVPALGEAGSTEIPYERLAQDLLARHGHAEANPDTFDMEEFLAGDFVHLRLGLFEVYMPAGSARDGDHAADYQRMLLAMLNAQGAWLDWLGPVADVRQARTDLGILKTWVRSIRRGQVSAVAAEGGGDLLGALDPGEKVLQASERFARSMGTGEALGLERADKREPVILAPERRDFLEFVSFAGWLYPELRKTFWQDGVATWTHTYVDDYKVLALEFASGGAGSWAMGVAMDSGADDGMAQQITQLATNSLIDSYFGDRIPPSLAGGLSVNLVIDIFGQCDTRVDGDLNSRRTAAFEVFVPGGRSEGGWLPARLADSRWREGQGADHFVAVLKAAQRAGASRAQRRGGGLQHFELVNDQESHRKAIRGPFLGSAAAGHEAPSREFLGDQLEFLRAYRSCFVHWLRERSRGSSKTSRRTFANLLRGLATSEVGLEEVFERVYSHPLSSEKLNKKDLEGAFLSWLARG